MPKNLSPKGKHYLEGMTIDDTMDVLKDMIGYGTHAIEYYNNISDVHYIFDNICNNVSDYSNSGFIEMTKQLSLRMLESKGALYQKLPFLFFVHWILQHAQDGNKWCFDDFQKVITNLYVYTSLFVIAEARKSKSTIDHSLYDTLKKDVCSARDVVLSAKQLRKQQVDSFEFPGNLNSFRALADLYTTMDYYVSEDNRICITYFDNAKFTLEHFIVPDNKNVIVRWARCAEEISIRLNSNVKQYKKRTTNYIVLPKALNGSLMEYDIITKVEKIREYYQASGIPRHISTVITYIEQLPEYYSLLALPSSTKAEEVKEKYERFVYKFFSDAIDSELRAKLTDNYKSTFRNEATT